MIMACIVSGAMAIVGIAEMIRRKWNPKTELTRKLVHLSMGAVSVSLPFLFDRPLPVLTLCGLLAISLAITWFLGILPSVHGVKRFTGGVIYYPAAVALLFVLSADRPGFYAASILVLTVCDTLAALVGGTYGRLTYRVQGESKSLEGSLIFFLSALLCIHVPILLLTPIGRAESLLASLLIAILVTLFEALSVGGIDNFIIPYGTYFILERITDEPIAVIVREIFILLCVSATILIITRTPRSLMSSGILAVVLMAYGTWSLGDPSWSLPVILLVGSFSLSWAVFRKAPGVPESGYELREVFHVFLVSFFILWTVNSWGLYDPLFIPFLSTLSIAFGLLLYAWLSLIEAWKQRCEPFHRAAAASAGTILFLFLPSLVFHGGVGGGYISLSGFICLAAIFLLCVYWEKRLKGTTNFLRSIAMGQAIVGPLVFSLQGLDENPLIHPVLFLRQIQGFITG